MNMLWTVSASLSLAVVAAVAEVMVRWWFSTEDIHATQLGLAVFTNVAALGALAVVVVSACWAMGWLVARTIRNTRPIVKDYLPCTSLGVVTGLLILQTNGLGLDQGLPDPHTVTIIALVLAVATAAAVGRRSKSEKTRLPVMTRVAVCLAWLLCIAFTGASLSKTNAHVKEWLHVNEEGSAPVAEKPPNIILVVIDTLRADRVGVYSNGSRSLTPNLDRLAESSIVYLNALSTAPWTLPAHASLFTGLYPETHGVNWGHYELDDRWPVIAELLKRRGYTTFGISNNWLLSRVNGFARGFDAFIETPTDPFLSRWRLALQCGVVNGAATWIGLPPEVGCDTGSAWTNWLLGKRLAAARPSERPTFIFINYFEPHDPYRPPPRYTESYLTSDQRRAYRKLQQQEDRLAAHACGLPDIFDDEQIGLLKTLYDAEVAYQDEVIGGLLNTLAECGFMKDSWIVITSDHGELFGEQGMLYHTASSHYKLLHVPLIVRPPGGIDGQRLEVPVQPVDVFVTLLEEAGVQIPDLAQRAYRLPLNGADPPRRALSVAQEHGASIAGLSIAQRMNMQADLAHWLTWVDSVYIDGYLLEVNSRGSYALFNVNEDPGMYVNLATVMANRAESMANLFESWRERHADTRSGYETQTRTQVRNSSSDRLVVHTGAGG